MEAGPATGDSVRLEVTIPRVLYDWLRAVAAADNVSMAAVIRQLLSRARRAALSEV